jgi:multiple sugar transport system substrate-binding protein
MNITKKHFMLLISLSILLTILCGCSEDNKPSSLSNTPMVMNMYVNSDDKRTIAAITEFNYENKVQIHYQQISTDQIRSGEYMKKVTTEIMAGEGPDILLESAYSFPALDKIVESKVFCDLDQYINEDKQFKLSDFNTKVLDCGVINKKRYYIPLNFRIHTLFSGSNLLQKNNISIDDSKWTLKDLHDIQTQYIKNQKAEKYVISTDLNAIVESGWTDYINISQKEVKFDSKDFIRLLEEYKTIYPSILTWSKIKYPELYFEYMKNDSLLFAYGDISPSLVWDYNSAVSKILNSQIKVFLYPGINGKNHPTGIVNEFIAINDSSKNKQEAFEFIKLLLSEKYQNYPYNVFLPVNKKASKSFVNNFTGDNGNNRTDVQQFIPSNQSRYTSVPLPDDICKQINNYIEDMDTCAYVDPNILKMINEEVASFIQGKQTSTQAAKMINNRVSIYLNE